MVIVRGGEQRVLKSCRSENFSFPCHVHPGTLQFPDIMTFVSLILPISLAVLLRRLSPSQLPTERHLARTKGRAQQGPGEEGVEAGAGEEASWGEALVNAKDRLPPPGQ